MLPQMLAMVAMVATVLAPATGAAAGTLLPVVGLQGAAKAGDAARVRQLLEEGYAVNHVTEHGAITALMWATDSGSLETVQLLVDAGAELSHRTTLGADALQVGRHARVPADLSAAKSRPVH